MKFKKTIAAIAAVTLLGASLGITPVLADSFTTADENSAAAYAVSEGVEINEANFPDEGFRKYVSERFDRDDDGILSNEEISQVTRINVTLFEKADGTVDREPFQSLKGIEYFTGLTNLDCNNNQLTSLDVSKNTALTNLHCESNQLTSLNVSNNTALIGLFCSSNQLTSLDVSNDTALMCLYCGSNQLTSLDVSNNTALTQLYCDGNQLTSLDVSNNTALIMLYCSVNQLTSLDVSNNTALDEFGCIFNQLTSLDVSNNTALTCLSCGNNQLTSLDISNNVNIVFINVKDNSLTSLDLSNNNKVGEENRWGVSYFDGNTYVIETNNSVFDLHKLEKYGFDASFASNWKGADVSGWTLTVDESTLVQSDDGKVITYDYDTQNEYAGKVTFYLILGDDVSTDTITPTTPNDSENNKPNDSVNISATTSGTVSTNYPTVIPIGGVDNTAVTPQKLALHIKKYNKPNVSVDVSSTGITIDMLNAFAKNKKVTTLTAQYGSMFKIEISKDDITGKTKAMDFSVSGKKFITDKQIKASKQLKNSTKIVQLDFNKKGKINGIDKVKVKTRNDINNDGKTAYIYELVNGKLIRVGECKVKSRGFVEFETDHLGQFVIAVK